MLSARLFGTTRKTKKFNAFIERVNVHNSMDFIMSLQGIFKMVHNMNGINEYSTLGTVGQIYSLVKRTNEWFAKHNADRVFFSDSGI